MLQPPTAVLLSAWLRASAPAPTPVLPLPVVVENSEYQPTPVFAAPVVRDFKRIAPFRCGEIRIASVRRRVYRLRSR